MELIKDDIYEDIIGSTLSGAAARTGKVSKKRNKEVIKKKRKGFI